VCSEAQAWLFLQLHRQVQDTWRGMLAFLLCWSGARHARVLNPPGPALRAQAFTVQQQQPGQGGDVPAGPSGAAGPADGPGGDAGGCCHVLQFSGLLPPWTVRRLLAFLAAHHAPGWAAQLEPQPASIPLSSAAVEEGAGAGAARGSGGAAGGLERPPLFAHGGAGSLDELTAWLAPASALAGRPVRGVVCSGAGRLCVRA
jgi:hypothetical protein